MNPDGTTTTFGERLRQLRLATGRSQQAVATAVGVGFPYISKLEKASGPTPGPELLIKIAAALDLDEPTTTELFRLAEKLPPTVEQLIVKEPEAMDFYRVAHRRLSEGKRREFFRSLIEQLESEPQAEPLAESSAESPAKTKEG